MRYLIFLFLIGLSCQKVQAQERLSFPKPIQEIINDFQSERISRENAISSIQYIFDHQELEHPLKCGNPLLDALKISGDELNKSVKKGLPQTASYYSSPSGKFRFEYYTSGSDSVWTADTDNSGVPDFVEKAGIEMDKIWQFQVVELGYRDPLVGINPYPISFKNLSYYGHTELNGKKIVVHSTFDGFTQNTDPVNKIIGALKVTLAHEFKHAIQYRYNYFNGNSHNWAEMDATLMEEVTYDEVNDYYNYLTDSGSLFRNPEQSVIYGSYEDVTFALYFNQAFGVGFWPAVWNRIGTTQPNFLLAMDEQLQVENSSLENEYPILAAWHFFSGFRSIPDFGFDEASYYPTIKATDFILGSLTQFTNDININRLAFRVVGIKKGNESGSVNVGVQGTGTASTGFVRFKNDDINNLRTFSMENGRFQVFRTDETWDETDTLFALLPGSVYDDSARAKILNIKDSDPSLFPWGDVDLSGTLNLLDVNTIIEDKLTGNQHDELNNWVADITQDGTVSGLDASLMLSVLNGTDSLFYIDSNKDGLMPEPELFRTQINGYQAPEIDSLFVSLYPLDAQNVDARLQVNLDYNTNPVANSIVLTLPIDTLNLVLQQVSLDSFINTAEMDYVMDGTNLKIMIVNDKPIPSGPIAVLLLNRKTLIKSASFQFSNVLIDEYDSFNLKSSILTTELPTRMGVFISDDGNHQETPFTFEVFPAYPNPFNPSTTISFSLPEPSSVQVTIFNYLGQKVHTFSQSNLSAGLHKYQWNANSVSSGMYLIQVSSKNKSHLQKVTLIK